MAGSGGDGHAGDAHGGNGWAGAVWRRTRQAALGLVAARRRAHERSTGLLEVHDLERLRGAELDAYVERIKPPDGRPMLPWLLIAVGPGADVAHGRVTPAWLGYGALAVFCALYAATVLAAAREPVRYGPRPKVLLVAMAVLAYGTAIAFGHNWVLTFILLALACGTVLRGRRLAVVLGVLAACDGAIAGRGTHDQWLSISTAYGTVLSGLVTAAVLSLHEVIRQLRSTRQELARNAVSQERLRFSRDLHDLLGHTMSVVVVKAEAVRRLAPRNLDAALGQAADIEAVARQALTEIREAVTGYREGSLPAELDRARSALDASGITLSVTRTGPPLPPRTEALLGWVVREGVTNVVRHSGAATCRIELVSANGRARLEITDDGDGKGSGSGGGTGSGGASGGGTGSDGGAGAGSRGASGGGGTGLTGLSERLAMAGGELTRGPSPRGGFRLAAELPALDDEPVA
ncbi:histidine kinase [Streptantibioticus silvisoli]|uniref:Histidine kinase n=1 Tax=Streptantibioticus silvisoli TaxID=2705255 RepID=A0ABT6VSX4_9ACTN|nr:histidine kinase [Streptantibioticus silvisoli]MDI5961576.1 histidine kinase [Streptantibioticus silvisoli]